MSSADDTAVQQAADAVLAEVRQAGCQQRESGAWCHVFLDGGDICQCRRVDLAKERMK